MTFALVWRTDIKGTGKMGPYDKKRIKRKPVHDDSSEESSGQGEGAEKETNHLSIKT